MAESSSPSTTEETIRLIKRLSANFAFKMSSLFSTTPIRNLDSRSIGAMAGLAIAVMFTWRAIRTPGVQRQRRQPKPRARRMQSAETSRAALQSNLASVAPEVSSPHEDYAMQDVVDQFFQPVKPSLGQIVRQKLSEGRKVTCRLLGVILEETSPEELQKQATMRSSVSEVLLEIQSVVTYISWKKFLTMKAKRRFYRL